MMVPYEKAKAGINARPEIMRLLQKFGCDQVGFMDNFQEQTLLLQFRYRGRDVQLKASAAGWAKLYLDAHPWHSRCGCSEAAWHERAITRGMVVVNSILRDWVKGQVTAVECGMMKFDHVFLPYMVTPDGKTVAERVQGSGMLALPE